MPRKSVFEMKMADVYLALIHKAERKGRTRHEVDQITSWLTGYSEEQIKEALASEMNYGTFLMEAPSYNPRCEQIKGRICGIQIETIEDPLTKRMRQLDKLIDELSKGKAIDKIFR